ncbi:MAG: PEP-CTERM sorting domain-containing protein [Betaproteobacteria bacterium]|nr:PEP-CTERM sorting domain-containing protein [Betaproteobacteria bacterium]
MRGNSRRLSVIGVLVVSSWAGVGHADSDVSRLLDLLSSTPDGGWVKANTNMFSDAWATGLDAVPPSSTANPASVIRAWSSFAWDSTRGQMIIFGGGHANYSGNEVYLWDGATGLWSRGSLPSRMEQLTDVTTGQPSAVWLPVDRAAPQSAHTYDNNLYLPVNDRFLTFGGASFNGGGGFVTAPVGDTTTANVTRAGPYLWDPSKADPNLVGGTTGSGYDPSRLGGNMWLDRQGQWTGTEAPRSLMGTTAYRTENGRDVVYLTSDQGSSGFADLYRYTLGDVSDPNSVDSWEKIGIMRNDVVFHGAGTLDTNRNLYVRTALNFPTIGFTSELAVWDLNMADPIHPENNQDIPIDLVLADGSDFQMTEIYGLDYFAGGDKLLLWDGGGEVWYVDVPDRDAAGHITNTRWVVHGLESASVDHPTDSFLTGVLGKWHYIPELDAFMGLEENTSVAGTDGSVWLYRPEGWTNPVPEPQTWIMMLAGLGLMGFVYRSRRSR